MGGWGSGGYNKAHRATNQALKLDSFEVGRCFLKGGKWIECNWDNGSSIKIVRDKEQTDSVIHFVYALTNKETGQSEKISELGYLYWHEGRYGGKYAYFLCSVCGKRVQFLYFEGKHFKCRECAKLNYPKQQVTKGVDEAILNLHRAAIRINPALSTLTPFDLGKYIPLKPYRMHTKRFDKLMMAFRKAQDEYYREFIKDVQKEFPEMIERAKDGEPDG